MAPNLLTLPREIRDQIYTHLNHDLRYRHAIVSTDRTCPKHGNIVRTTIEDAPCFGLLLSHSQLHDEYLCAIQHQTRSARIRMDTLSEFVVTRIHTWLTQLKVHSGGRKSTKYCVVSSIAASAFLQSSWMTGLRDLRLIRLPARLRTDSGVLFPT
jgi:hypothetical protein